MTSEQCASQNLGLTVCFLSLFDSLVLHLLQCFLIQFLWNVLVFCIFSAQNILWDLVLWGFGAYGMYTAWLRSRFLISVSLMILSLSTLMWLVSTILSSIALTC